MVRSQSDNVYLARKERELLQACPKCRGRDLSCECFRLFRAEMMKVEGGIPEKYRTATLDIFTEPEMQCVVHAVTDYICNIEQHARAGTGLFMWGKGHYGKTYVACAVLNAVASAADIIDPNVMPSAYEPIMFINTHDLFTAIVTRSETNEAVLARAALMKKLETVKFLCIDDITFMYKKPTKDISYAESMLMGIFRNRTNSLLPTIVTSKLSMQAVKDENVVIGSHLVSAAKEHLIAIEFPGYDAVVGVNNAKRHAKTQPQPTPVTLKVRRKKGPPRVADLRDK